ncbi:MAG: methylmalonyl Co-A mutase-associated GTPase MeaB, partial [Thermoprotei archaeon]
MSSDVTRLISGALKKDKASVSKLITLVETDPLNSITTIARVPYQPKTAHVVGFTGSAGVGKSTLINAVATLLAQEGSFVAVVAVDPRSPITGGAILGDRVRMKNVPKEVYVRSMTTREEESLPLKTLLTVELLERLGFDYIILETPGAGQFSTRIMSVADTIVVVLMPESGDEIQAIKAGIMEIGDIYVINKADLPGANLTYNQVLFALNSTERRGWVPKVVLTNALSIVSVEPLINVIKEHATFVREKKLDEEKRVLRRSLELQLIISEELNKVVKEVSMPQTTLFKEFEKLLRDGGSLRELIKKIRE